MLTGSRDKLHRGDLFLGIFNVLKISYLLPGHNLSRSFVFRNFPWRLGIISESEYRTLLHYTKDTFLKFSPYPVGSFWWPPIHVVLIDDV